MHQQKNKISFAIKKIDPYLHQELIFSTFVTMPLQNRVTDAARQTAKTLLHVHEYQVSLEAFPHNFSDVTKFIKSEYDNMIKAEVK